MAVDILQEKIRKLKNPTVLELGLSLSQIPTQFEKNAAGIKDLFYYMSKQVLDAYGEEVQIRGICRDEVNGNMIGKLFPHIQPLLVHRGVCITLDEEE